MSNPARKLIYLSVLPLLLFAGCSSEKDPANDRWLAMGTFASVSVPARESEKLTQYASVARTAIQKLENDLSVFNPESKISKLNKSAGRSPVSVSAHTREVLELALKYAEVSQGCFDPTVGPLVRLWGFNDESVLNNPLAKTVVSSLLDSVGYKHLVLSNATAYLDIPNARLDLGGIAKGYTVDVCYRKIMQMKAENVMINLGGNIRCRGVARNGRPWKIGVQNPFNRNRIIGTISLTDGMAVATSGNYERFVMIGGKRYAHIIDPRTGYPVEGMAGVTVISATAVEADAMSTALFVLGVDESKPLLDSMPDCYALFIPDEQPPRIWISPGFSAYFTPHPAFDDRIEVIKQ